MKNLVILIGRLGKDPVLRFTPDGKPVCDLSLATNKFYKDASGEKQTLTEWHRVTVWGNDAENAAQYLSKGRQVYIQGSLKTDVVGEGDDRRYYTKVVADPGGVIYLGSNGSAPQVSQDGFESTPESDIPF